MTESPEVPDWTRGEPGLAFARCRACGEVQYDRRPHCPRCGATDFEVRAASGRGIVYALTRVERAPSPEWRQHAPYGLALVDAAEGFRFMAHAADGLAIGDRVRTAFHRFGPGLVLRIEPDAEPEGRT